MSNPRRSSPISVSPSAKALEGPLKLQILTHRGDEREFLSRIKNQFPSSSTVVNGVEFLVEVDEPADVVVVLNYLKYDRVITARLNGVWRWDNEPITNSRNTTGYDKVFSSNLDIREKQLVPSAPVLAWWVKKSFDELKSLEVPQKTRDLSAIASNRRELPGHRVRADFVSRVEKEIPIVEIFGSGRNRELIDKWDGLADFRYSIAIENSSKPHYWTEKLADCFLAYTVPLYFGATNLDRYFPRESYIWLPVDNPDKAIGVIRETLETDSWSERLEPLREARELFLNKYSFASRLSLEAGSRRNQLLSAPFVTRKVHGRRTQRGGWKRGVGLLGNLAALRSRRAARLKSRSRRN